MKQNNLKIALALCIFFASYSFQAQSKSAIPQSTNQNQPLVLNEENQRFFDENGVVRCASMEAHELLMQSNPDVQSLEEFENWLAPLVEEKKAQMIQDIQNGSTSRVVYNIPIIFHVITGSAGDANDIDAQYINAQIDQLNLDFNNMAGTPYATYPAGPAHSAEINFIPAQVDPNGVPLAEPGIDRQYGYAGTQSQGTMNGGIKQATIWDRSQYANIWVADLSGGLLGYAQFPTNSTLPGMPANGGSAQTDGVVCLTSSIGSVATPYPGGAPYNLGRTLTHEMGHWIGLFHIWGDANCGNDYCADTPTQQGASGGCPNTTTCDGVDDMVENYMDYSYDACMNIFTFDQVGRMLTVIDNADGFGDLVTSTTGNTSPAISFSTPTVNEMEGTDCTTRDIDIPVVIGMGASANAMVTFTPSGSATNNEDYQIITPSVTFASGATDSQTLTLRINQDGFEEGDETIIINMTLNANGGDAELASNGNETLTVTLTNDDAAPGGTSLATIFDDGFEAYADFAIGNVGGWTMIDGDGDATWGSDNYTFPNENYTGTFMVYNASATTPSSAGTAWDSHSGAKGYYCFNSNGSVSGTPLNNDIIFSPAITLNGTGSTITYWAKGLTDHYNGGERYRVGISNVNDGTGITYLTALPYIQPTLEWAEYSLAIPSSFDGSDVHLVFHVVSNDEFVFMLDDVSVTTNVVSAVQTAVNTATSAQMDLNGMGTAYAYDSADNSIMAKITNNDSFDYGCADVSVSRAGTGAQLFQNPLPAEYVMDKVFTVTTDTPNTSGDVMSTFYVTEAEIAGWEAATGKNRADLYIFRMVNGIVEESTAASLGNYGTDKTLSGSFTGANGLFYFGPINAQLSIDDNVFEAFNMYPNPANNAVTIQLKAANDVQITLYDVRGRKVFTNTYDNNSALFNKTINLDAITTGLYLIQIESGKQKVTKKLVVK
ncbi:MAG: T9SS type A sorting domain-containing protein [Oceanihabitans sp.]